MRIAACLIVKNEAQVIRRCLDSVADRVDAIAVIDTGSTDGTVEAIEGLPYRSKVHVARRPWVNFGHNRTELLRLASHFAHYLLMLDADQTVGGSIPRDLAADCYHVRLRSGSLEWVNMLLIRSALPWRYEGVTHEYLTCETAAPPELLDGLTITEHADGGGRPSGYQPRWEWDAEVLERECSKLDPSPRDVFYLARTYDDLAATRPDHPQAAEWRAKAAYRYLVRSAMSQGYDDERWWSLQRYGALAADDNKGLTALLEAIDQRPGRWEPVYEACRLLNRAGRHHVSYALSRHAIARPASPTGLFVRRDVYDYLLPFEHSVSAFYVGEFRESYDTCRKLLGRPDLPANVLEATRRNIQFPAERLENR